MADETPESSGVNGEPPQPIGGEPATPEPEPSPDPDTAAGKTPAVEAAEPGSAPASPSTPTPPAASAPEAPTEHGQRRITRHTTTSTTRTETTTDEQIVETVAVAPPVWAAPAGEHPRPVG